jgi:copper(I)-binding protein
MRRFPFNLAAARVLTATMAAMAVACAFVEQTAAGQGYHQATLNTPLVSDGANLHVPKAGMFRKVILTANEPAATASSAVVVGDLEVTDAWARVMLPGQPTGGGYITITNRGSEADRLVAASSPAAGKVEIHTMAVVDDVMVMRPAGGALEIPAGGTVEMKPGGMHLMFMQVSKPFRDGEEIAVSLEFETAGKVAVVLPVRASSGAPDHDAGHDHGN